MKRRGISSRIACSVLAVILATGQFLATAAPGEQEIPLNVSMPRNTVMDNRAYFVGQVQREYIDNRSKEVAKQVNFSNYISDEAKTITSITGETKWSYGEGIATVNTPNAQGAAGFLNKREVFDFDDISFTTENEYITLIAISLDDKPLAESNRILLQTMTQDNFFGYEERPLLSNTGEDKGRREIVSVGEPPWNIVNIDVDFVLKNAKDLFKISVLDENGYYREELGWELQADGSARINLKNDTIYAIIERGVTESSVKEAEAGSTYYVWWEGEDYLETNFPARTEFSEDTFPEDKVDALSGGSWLTNEGTMTEEDETPYIKYEIDIEQDGMYNFFIRRFWRHGPFMYRFGDGEWVKYTEISLQDQTPIRQFLEVNWVSAGEVELKKGRHILEIRQINKSGEEIKAEESKVACYDAFLLVNGPFVPLALKKPNERLTNAMDGHFAFSPAVDTYEDSVIDLRYLNEEVAGQDGYMYADGDIFRLANGTEVRLWSTVVGQVMFADNATIDNFARKMAKYGINLVRIHKGIFDYDLQISDVRADRIKYFFSALKRNGIYSKISLYFSLDNRLHLSETFGFRGVTDEGLLDGFLEYQKEGFAYMIWNEHMQEVYLESIRKLITSENPYGDTPMVYDPALAIIEVQNEDSFFFGTSGAWRWPTADQVVFAKIFGSWLVKKYGSINNAVKEWGNVQPTSPRSFTYDNYAEGAVSWLDPTDFSYNPANADWQNMRRRDFREFLAELQHDFYANMIEKIHDMGYQGMTIAGNWRTIDNARYDGIEHYTYLPADINDHHNYNNNFYSLENAPGDTSMTYAVVAGQRFYEKSTMYEPYRCAVKVPHTKGQPSTISEICWTNPTQYGTEGVFLEAVYGSLQGIDGIMNYEAEPDWSAYLRKFPMCTPGTMGQFPAFALLYRRGDVKEAQIVAYESVTLESMVNEKRLRIYNEVFSDGMRLNQ